MINRNISLVVIDDDEDTQELIKAFFKPKGYKVTLFSDAESAMKTDPAAMAQWDVVLVDLQLPRMSGFELIEKVRIQLPELPVILITSTKSAEIAVKAIKKGAYDFIVKPIHFAQLLVSVERAVHFKTLKEDIVDLREQIKEKDTKVIGEIIGKSPKFLACLDVARKIANSAANVFISGESGTGKEVIARYIHSQCVRRKGPFVAINCSAIPENLLESELFGHSRGSFTGASENKRGLFEEAQNGTLFLDEIGDLSLPLQAKLLRVLQEKKIRRVGENQMRSIDARVISATHKNLMEEVTGGGFREDLFFRLNVIPIHLPPLRDRQEDILPMAHAFLKRFAVVNASSVQSFTKEATRFLLENEWKGNVRELENSIERAVVMSNGVQIEESDFLLFANEASTFGMSVAGASSSGTFNSSDFVLRCSEKLPSVQEVIQRYIEFAVIKNRGAKDKTAKDIGIDRKTLYKRLKPQSAFMN